MAAPGNRPTAPDAHHCNRSTLSSGLCEFANATRYAVAPAIDQRHHVGGRDTNVPPSVVQSFARRHPAAQVIEIADYGHECCRLERWPQLLADTGSAAP
jgi:hypothetical protein